ncbi:MAG: CxxxxCH/CxxCH domain-containing protein [Deltaproteobacteria bacterium]|nr:CxxxxCH/CxxCH domain-containing protein [Deltaproteobacteria bacterium]
MIKSLVSSCFLCSCLLLLPSTSHGDTDCQQCHVVTSCSEPTRPQGNLCIDCHLGTEDIDDYTVNFIPAQIDTEEWYGSGHGGYGFADTCGYCHAPAVNHFAASNPFRLANTTGPGPDGQNGVCLVCHATVAAGYGPEGSSPITASSRIESYHFHYKHSAEHNGGSFCWDCHDPHGDAAPGPAGNIAMIHKQVTKQSDGSFGIPQTTVEVSFTANATGADFAAIGSDGPYDKICQVCHEATEHYTINAGDGHHLANKCTGCHQHNGDGPREAFKPSGCDGCHGNPPTDSTPCGPTGLICAPEDSGSLTAGAHAKHATGIGYNYPCQACHYSGMKDAAFILDNKIQMGFNTFGFDGSNTGYHGQTSVDSTGTPYHYEGTNGTAIQVDQSMTCANTYCHGNGITVNTPSPIPSPTLPRAVMANTSPSWDAGPQTCDTCHGYPPAYPDSDPAYQYKANSHQRHNFYSCNVCHYGTTSDGVTITGRSKHANGAYDVVGDPTLGVHIDYNFDVGGGTCSNIVCHTFNSHHVVIDSTPTWGYNIFGLGSSQLLGGGNQVRFYVIAAGEYGENVEPPFIFHINYGDNTSGEVPAGPDGRTAVFFHTYPAPGTYTFTIWARDKNNHRSSAETSYPKTVSPSPTENFAPEVNVTYEWGGPDGRTITLTGRTVDHDYDYGAGPGLILIRWRDGQTEQHDVFFTDQPSLQVFTHSYDASQSGRTKTIEYNVQDNVGSNVIRYIEVTIP